MTLMLTLGTAAFGAQKTLPSGKDKGSINVTNLKPGDTVTAYQFVKADNTSGEPKNCSAQRKD